MAIDHNGPDAPYPGPEEQAPETGAVHGSGLEQTESEPKQGAGEKWSEKRPEDWNPPPGDPGSGQDAQDDAAQKAGPDEGEVPLPADDESPIEEEMRDVDANNSVSSEHP
ncbi:hypothetical protein OGV25_09460 [Pseudomonas sp. P1B16]|jgi:hypothetical protein|uniref:hypothetical protein n=1 Tax=Pseudomonas TaxID=286 RepID=UPI000512EC20|nr:MULTISPECIES: hypothetical protein [unclassified Pseudomonas]KGI94370.1 hypothetical protein MD26_05560 [Pseudomonas sp. H2]UPL09320.1 hypothetical protein PisoF_05028 [Pseudomonas sp. IsoF]WPM28342.1 hypothetical protein OGV25_09460 [Pseudomonas sp. P1B16]